MSVGEAIKDAREARGWSQRELARRSRVSVSYISMLERGERNRISAEILQRIAQPLDISLEKLMNAAPAEDLSRPPVDLLRAAGYSEGLITRLTESWPRQPHKFRSEVVRQAQRRIEEAQHLHGAIL